MTSGQQLQQAHPGSSSAGTAGQIHRSLVVGSITMCRGPSARHAGTTPVSGGPPSAGAQEETYLLPNLDAKAFREEIRQVTPRPQPASPLAAAGHLGTGARAPPPAVLAPRSCTSVLPMLLHPPLAHDPVACDTSASTRWAGQRTMTLLISSGCSKRFAKSLSTPMPPRLPAAGCSLEAAPVCCSPRQLQSLTSERVAGTPELRLPTD